MPRVGDLAIVGVTERSIRIITPASSSRRNTSSSDAEATAASNIVAGTPR